MDIQIQPELKKEAFVFPTGSGELMKIFCFAALLCSEKNLFIHPETPLYLLEYAGS